MIQVMKWTAALCGAAFLGLGAMAMGGAAHGCSDTGESAGVGDAGDCCDSLGG
jgi:hypothetical protein